MKAKLIFLGLLSMTLCLFSCDKKGNVDGGKPVEVIESLSNEISSSADSWTKEDWDAAAERLKTAIAGLPSKMADDELIIVNSAIPRMKVYAERHKNMAATFLVALSKYKSTGEEGDVEATDQDNTSPEATGMGGTDEEMAPASNPSSIYDRAPAGLLLGNVIQEGGYTNVRQQPSTNSPIVTKIRDGSPIYYTNYNGSWCVVYDNGGNMLGYMHSSKVVGLDEGTPDEGGDVVYGTQYDWLSTRYATASDLAGYDLGQLRVLRNSIYARHGRMFRDANLRSYFNSQPWYNGYRQEIPASELNQYEQYNIQFIQSRE